MKIFSKVMNLFYDQLRIEDMQYLTLVNGLMLSKIKWLMIIRYMNLI